MEEKNKTFEIEKTFGLSVLFKLIQKDIGAIEISANGKSYIAHASLEELNKMVDAVLRTYKIRLCV